MTVTTRVHQVTRRLSPETPYPPIRLLIAGSLEPAVCWTGFTTPVLLTGCRSPLLGWTLAEDDPLSITVEGTVIAIRRGPHVFTLSLVLAKLSLGPSEINTRRGPFDASEGGKWALSVL